MNLVKLQESPEKLCEIAENFRLKISKLSEDNENHVYEAVSKKQLGVTEFETVNRFAEGIKTLIDAENSLWQKRLKVFSFNKSLSKRSSCCLLYSVNLMMMMITKFC